MLRRFNRTQWPAMPLMQRKEAATGEGDALPADAEAADDPGTGEHVHQVGGLAVLQEETAAGGSSPLDRDQGPGACQGERVPRRQADRAPGAREGPEGDVWTQLRAAAVHPEIAQ